jgi:hypothetical protein
MTTAGEREIPVEAEAGTLAEEAATVVGTEAGTAAEPTAFGWPHL